MSNKKFKTLNGYIQSATPVAEGKKLHNYASVELQVDSNSTERVVFFFAKPAKSSHAFNNVNQYAGKDVAVSITGLIQNEDACEYIDYDRDQAELKKKSIIQREKNIRGQVSSCKTSIWISCPKCKNRTDSNDIIVTCTNCNSSFRSKNQTLKVEVTVEGKY
ncbi:unnamed protein product [Rotaria sp. Silwood1]|nr:unnamed protein product [Rotaria sp. Silwood1]CAF3390813.1 unnamed protein product [Rotaria sp. Silwood1]CAF4598255.1 unnamed protein product [Rotaria sp. Silwood1]CAF4753166.1 unnamed protein product [Rotaria sp. Silwood1]CAF4957927.1 unnamed protein product [Rotaria sp. Silwood1]